MSLFDKIVVAIKSGDDRAKLLKRNIFQIFLFRAVNVFVSFLIVPITIKYLNPYDYGIWITLSSFMVWIELMDLGIANGLRNKLTESIAVGNKQLSREYVSSAYFFLAVIASLIFISFLLLSLFVNWNKALNIQGKSDIQFIFIIIIFFFSLRFIFKTIGTIVIADQKPNIDALISALGSLFSLIFIYVLTRVSKGSLITVASIFSSVPIFIYFISSVKLFSKEYNFIKPSFKFIKRSLIKDLLNLGVRFFIIQLSCLIIFSSINFLILKWFGANAVTQYNIAYKYFYTIILVFTIIITPLWSAFSDAYVKGDLIWIRSIVRKIEFTALLFIVLAIILLLLSQFFYKIWIRNAVIVPFNISLAVCIYTISYILQQTYIYVVNGTGKVYIQTLLSIILTTTFIPAAYFLSKSIGVSGIIYTSALTQIPLTIMAFIQYHMIVKNRLHGLWNK